METIIKKAIEGGYDKYFKRYDEEADYTLQGAGEILVKRAVLDPLFWQALGKVCGWEGHSPADVTSGECEYMGDWIGNGITFHEINLTEGWEKAVEYLQQITNIK